MAMYLIGNIHIDRYGNLGHNSVRKIAKVVKLDRIEHGKDKITPGRY